MKFDCIIMNPPYKRNLHLKILAEAIKRLKDDDSKVVNLSPVRWLQDPLAKYKKNCDLKRFDLDFICACGSSNHKTGLKFTHVPSSFKCLIASARIFRCKFRL